MGDTYLYRTKVSNNMAANDRDVIRDAPLAIFNAGTDVVEVLSIWLDRPTGKLFDPAVAYIPGKMQLARITSLTGGTDVTVVKQDTDNATLPSQVKIVVRPTEATLGDVIRQVVDTPGIDQVSTMLTTALTPGEPAVGSLWCQAGSNRAPIVLREGEGFAVAMVESTYAHPQSCYAIIRNQASGATYSIFSDDVEPWQEDQRAFFAIWNGVGSGVILEVVSVEWIDLGQMMNMSNVASQPHFRLASVKRVSFGTVVAPVLLDTSSPAAPSTLIVQKNADVGISGLENLLVGDAGFATGSPMITFIFLERMGCLRRFCFKLPSQGMHRQGPRSTEMLMEFKDSPGIVLRGGEGLAVVANGVRVYSSSPLVGSLAPQAALDLDVCCLLTIRADSSVGGGGPRIFRRRP